MDQKESAKPGILAAPPIGSVSVSKLSKPQWCCLLDAPSVESLVRSSVTKSETASAKNDMRRIFLRGAGESGSERYVVGLGEKVKRQKENRNHSRWSVEFTNGPELDPGVTQPSLDGSAKGPIFAATPESESFSYLLDDLPASLECAHRRNQVCEGLYHCMSFRRTSWSDDGVDKQSLTNRSIWSSDGLQHLQ